MNNGEPALKNPELQFNSMKPGIVNIRFTIGSGKDAMALTVYMDFKTRELMGYTRQEAAPERNETE